MTTFPAAIDTLASLGAPADGVTAALTSPLLIGDLTAQVDNAVHIPQWSLITFADELDQVTLVVGNTLTLARGLSGTTVAAHAVGVVGSLDVNAWYLEAHASAIIAIETAVAPFAIAPAAFTPVLAFGGSTVGIAYAVAAGDYVIVGGLVNARISLELTSKGFAHGNATISGLPVAAGGGIGGAVFATLLNMAGLNGPVATVVGETISLYNTSPVGSVWMTDANFTDTSLLQLSLTYRV